MLQAGCYFAPERKGRSLKRLFYARNLVDSKTGVCMKLQFRLVTKQCDVNFKVHVPASWLIIFVVGNINLVVQFIFPYLAN
jgi:hypothetical protein